MDLASPLALLQLLAAQLPEDWITASLARRCGALEHFQEQERASGHWQARSALQLAHLWLVAGRAGRGDDLVLEAHQMAPQAGLIPDWWGLWPNGEPEGRQEAERLLAASYVQLRHLPPLAAWQAWLEAVRSEIHRIDEPALRLLLGLVIQGRDRLPGPLEPPLEQLVGEELVAREPALAWRFFDPLCERLPHWAYGRLKAADLSLQRGALERCGEHLQAASDDQWQLAWLHDIAARLALAQGDVEAALAGWQRAMERCQADGRMAGQAEVMELFRQRAREARRGPGVLQARSLLNRGEQGAAIQLLEALLRQDPQWQPLRSLLEQARPSSAQAASPAGSSDVQRLEGRLQQLAHRAGLPWPLETLPPPRDLAAAEGYVQTALARLALLG
jgi:hypothetical protein